MDRFNSASIKRLPVKVLRQLVIPLWMLALLYGIDDVLGADGLATKAISGGAVNSVVLKNDGTVWVWGYNQYGEGGDSSGTSTSLTRTNPVVWSTTFSNGVAVAGGGWAESYSPHTLALRNDGTVWATGRNQYGELGDGT